MADKQLISILNDDAMENVSGGTAEQLNEIFDYISAHDPAAYENIMTGSYPPVLAMSKYLYEKGIPMIGIFESYNNDNAYYFGEWGEDPFETGREVSHEEVMKLIREKIG